MRWQRKHEVTQLRLECEAARLAETTWRSAEAAEEAAAMRTAGEASTYSSPLRKPCSRQHRGGGGDEDGGGSEHAFITIGTQTMLATAPEPTLSAPALSLIEPARPPYSASECRRESSLARCSTQPCDAP